MELKGIIQSETDLPVGFVDDALRHARRYVKRFKIKKKNGGERVIYHPAKKLKVIQYWLLLNVFDRLPVHRAAMAYRSGLSIMDNAAKHRHGRYFLRLDFSDFFPSIKYHDLEPKLVAWHKLSAPAWELNEEAKLLIRLASFGSNDELLIGYPTSPSISNAVMYEADDALSKLAQDTRRFGRTVYTRYADDLVFSTDIKGACRDLESAVRDLVKNLTAPRLRINDSKTRYGSSSGGTASVTGIRVCEGGHLTIHRRHKDHIRLLLGLYTKGRLSAEEQRSLIGHLQYCRHVAPQFYSSLQIRRFREIAELMGRGT
ncbi:MAG: retron St85 family RNA-directed DNA polymerase [Gammaproteobacteria bacterium]